MVLPNDPCLNRQVCQPRCRGQLRVRICCRDATEYGVKTGQSIDKIALLKWFAESRQSHSRVMAESQQ